jgi:hypothetical protein
MQTRLCRPIGLAGFEAREWSRREPGDIDEAPQVSERERTNQSNPRIAVLRTATLPLRYPPGQRNTREQNGLNKSASKPTEKKACVRVFFNTGEMSLAELMDFPYDTDPPEVQRAKQAKLLGHPVPETATPAKHTKHRQRSFPSI